MPKSERYRFTKEAIPGQSSRVNLNRTQYGASVPITHKSYSGTSVTTNATNDCCWPVRKPCCSPRNPIDWGTRSYRRGGGVKKYHSGGKIHNWAHSKGYRHGWDPQARSGRSGRTGVNPRPPQPGPYPFPNQRINRQHMQTYATGGRLPGDVGPTPLPDMRMNQGAQTYSSNQGMAPGVVGVAPGWFMEFSPFVQNSVQGKYQQVESLSLLCCDSFKSTSPPQGMLEQWRMQMANLSDARSVDRIYSNLRQIDPRTTELLARQTGNNAQIMGSGYGTAIKILICVAAYLGYQCYKKWKASQ